MSGFVRCKLLVAGFLVVLGASPVWAQDNVDAGMTPAQLYAADCAICHKTPQGLTKGGGVFGLSSFLREHYTASRETAGAIAQYLKSIDHGPAVSEAATRKRTVTKPSRKDEKRKIESGKSEKKSGEKKPEEGKSSEKKSSESKPVDARPAETKPAETKPTEAKPAESKPAESKPVEAKPASDVKPAQGAASESKPADSKPVESKPADSKLPADSTKPD